MHNMAGSSSIPVESLRDPKFTQEFGTTFTLLWTMPVTIILLNRVIKRGVRLTPPELGAYDYYAIAWLYTPIFEAKTAEEEILFWINGSVRSLEMLNIAMVNNNSDVVLTQVQ